MPRLVRSKASGKYFVKEDDGTVRDPTPDELQKKGVSQPRPVAQPLRFNEISEGQGGLLNLRQRIVHDLLALNEDKQVEYVKSLGFKTRRDRQGRAFYRAPGATGQWKLANPKGFDRGDAVNIALQVGTALIPGTITVKAGLRGPQALAALGAGTGAVELGRQVAGQMAGVPGNIDPGRVVTEGALAAALPVAMTGATNAVKAGTRAITRATRRFERPAMSIAAKAAGLSDTGVQAEEALAFRMANKQNLPGFINVADELANLASNKGKLIPEAAQAAQFASRQVTPTDLRGVVDDLNKALRDPKLEPSVLNHLRQTRNIVISRLRRLRNMPKQRVIPGVSGDPLLNQFGTQPITEGFSVDQVLADVPAKFAQPIKRLLQSRSGFKPGETIDAGKAGAKPFTRAAGSSARKAMEGVLDPITGGGFSRLNATASEKNRIRARLLKAIRSEPEIAGAAPTTESFLKSLFAGPDTIAKQRLLGRFDKRFGTSFLADTRRAQIGSMFGGPGGQPETRPFLTAGGGLRGPALARAAVGTAIGGPAGTVIGGPVGGILGAAVGAGGLMMTTPRGVVKTASKVAGIQNFLEKLASGQTIPSQDRALAQLLLPILASGASGTVNDQGRDLLNALMEQMGQRRGESDLLSDDQP